MNLEDSEIEEAIIGACLIEQDALPLVAEKLKPEMFYVEKHRIIFETLMEMFNDGKKIDILTVKDALFKKGKLDAIGGPYAIAQLSSKVASSAHLEYHAQILMQNYMRRAMVTKLSMLTAEANDPTIDIDDTMIKMQATIDNIGQEAGYYDHTRNMKDIVSATLKQAEKRAANNRNGVTGIPTGIKSLDQITCGLQNGDLIVLAARPSVGKSAFALNMALNAAKQGFPVAFYSLEMACERLCDRMLVSLSSISPEGWRSGQYNEYERRKAIEALDGMTNYPISINDAAPMGMDRIRSNAHLLKAKGRCSMIVIDYLQLAQNIKQDKWRNREQEVAEMSHKAKQIAQELNVPVVLLSQLNRAVEIRPDKRPELADLRESGAIEQDADVVLIIHRRELTRHSTEKSKSIDPSQGILIVAKQRNGPTGDVYFSHNPSMTRICDYVPNQLFQNNRGYCRQDEEDIPF